MLLKAYPSDPAQVVRGAEERSWQSEGPHRRFYAYLKLCIEWVLALMMMIVAAPLILVLATLVKLTSAGPAFYLQSRLGCGGRVFRIIKLRTMTHNCEQTTGPVWSLPGDRRVTPLGRLLRDTHLDELPQLFNILFGHMSLVGPRPERPEIAGKIEKVMPEFHGRLRVRPGVTGLAQMRLPADTDMEGVRHKLAHDLYYVREMSLLLDVRIVVSTAFYFLGAFSHAIRDALVKSYGQVVERSLLAAPDAASKACEMVAAES